MFRKHLKKNKNKKKNQPFPGRSDLYANIPQHLSPKLKDFEVQEVFLNIKFITALMKWDASCEVAAVSFNTN